MDSKKVFDKYYSRLAKESIIKSILCSAAIGLGLAFALALVFWFIDFEFFWISVLIGVAVAASLLPLFYYKRFRPTTRAVAHRIDRLGLEERIITMTELENDDSYIAMRQREDAKAAIAAVTNRTIKLSVPRNMLAVTVAVLVACLAMVLINIFSVVGIMPKASEIIDQITSGEEQYYTVSYICYGEGYIEGDEEQVVAIGESTEMVVAVADDGYYFDGWHVFIGWSIEEVNDFLAEGWLAYPSMWNDEIPVPERIEENVIDNMTVVAVFRKMGDPGDDGEPGDGEPGDGEPGDEGEPGDGSGDGMPGDPDNGNNGNNGQSDNNGAGEGGGAGDGKNIQDNTHLDGETPIDAFYQEYLELAMKMLAEGKELPEDLRRIIEAYFGGML
ncbi:MAG: hypothetical protein J1G01_01830 [Clostridiales bacterium]|nr:hypothetical protein [Clostridiales bacterium]